MKEEFLTVIYADGNECLSLVHLVEALSKLRVIGRVEIEPRFLGYDAWEQQAVMTYLNITPRFDRKLTFDTNVVEIAVSTK